MENNEQKEITLSPESAIALKKLSKEIMSFDSQNMFMTFIHMLIILSSLALGTTYIMQYIDNQDVANGTAICAISIFEIIDLIAFKIITQMNNKQKMKNEELIRKIIEDELSKQNTQ